MHDLLDIIRKFTTILTKKQKKKLFLIYFLMVVGAVLEVIGVSLIVPLISLILKKDFFESNSLVISVSNFLGISTAKSFIIFLLLLLSAVFILKNLYLIFEYFVQLKFIRNNKICARVNTLWLYLTKPYDFFFNEKPGDLLRETSTDVTNSFNMLQEFLSLCTEFVIALSLIVAVFVIDSLMAILISFVLLIEVLIIYKKIKPILKNAGNEWNSSIANSNKWILQSFDGIKEIKVAQKEAYFLNRFKIYAEESSKSEFISSIFSHVPRLMIESMTVVSMLVIVACIVFFGGNIETVLPKLSAFAVAAVKLLPSVNRITSSINYLTYNKPCLDNASKTFLPSDTMIATDKNNSLHICLPINDSVQFQKLSYKYPNTKKNVLKSTDMIIPIGSMVGVIGESGSGKTTAIDILLGLLNPVEGDVVADGISINNKKSEFLNNIGYIPQQIFILDGTIRDNVAFGIEKKDINDDKVWTCLRNTELETFIKSLPDGLDTEVGDKGVRLSGGQRQRIGIARALYSSPKILVFDEATSALDNNTEKSVMGSIESLHGKVTLVIIAHRLSTIENCDIVYEVKKGQIIRVR